ncbi:NTP transferase domain-containing protein [bacterium]|nr:NTP transferase domain-containing protein [candidate division CSSED10-310 bacterium]
MNLYCVILAGGRGKRFWPVSRRQTPKQYLPIVGSRPMIRQTADRISPLIPMHRVMVVTGRHLRSSLLKVMPDLDSANIFLEPVGRNTAPAIAWPCIQLVRTDPDAVLAVLASDHVIGDETAFRNQLKSGVELAWKDRSIVTLGIRPIRPETGYGYLKTPGMPEPVCGIPCYRIERFVEKPDRRTAQRYLDQPGYFWNSGMFIFRADRMVEEIRRHQPRIFAGINSILDSGNSEQVVDRIFPSLPDISIDYGIMEKAAGIRMLAVDFPWADVGSWAALFDHLSDAGDGNRIQEGSAGKRLFIDSKNVMVHGDRRFVAVIGVDDVIVVETDDALLVCRRDRSQDVGEVVKRLEQDPGRNQYI